MPGCASRPTGSCCDMACLRPPRHKFYPSQISPHDHPNCRPGWTTRQSHDQLMEPSLFNVRASLVLLLTGVIAAGCGDGGAAESANAPAHSPTQQAVQHVSDQTICDLVFRNNGVMAKSVALMSELQTSSTSSREARAYAREARQIGSHASGDMATKVEALSRSLRAYAAWVDSSVGKFRGEDFAVAGLELGNTCGLALPEGQNSLGDPQDGASPTLTGSSESNGIR